METFDIPNVPPTETIRMMANYINRITAANDRLPARSGLTRFHARTIPTIDVQGYLNRILKYAPCGNECFLAVLIYLDRMTRPKSPRHGGVGRKSGDHQTAIVMNSLNVHRLLISGIMVAVKFLSDIFFTNTHISRVGGLPVQELNALEIEFLLIHDFNLNVSVEEIQQCGNLLLAHSNASPAVHDVIRDRLLLSPPESREEGRSRSSSIASVPYTPERPYSPQVASPTRRFRAKSDVGGPAPGSIGAAAIFNGSISPMRQTQVFGRTPEERYANFHASESPSRSQLTPTTPQSVGMHAPSPAAEPHHRHGSYSPNVPISVQSSVSSHSSNGTNASAPQPIKSAPRWNFTHSFTPDSDLVRHQDSTPYQHQSLQSHHQQSYVTPRSNSTTPPSSDTSPKLYHNPSTRSQSHLHPPSMYRQHSDGRAPSPNGPPVMMARSGTFPTPIHVTRQRAQSHSIPRPSASDSASSEQHLRGAQPVVSDRISHRLHRVVVDRPVADYRFADDGRWGGPKSAEPMDSYGRVRTGGLVMCREV